MIRNRFACTVVIWFSIFGLKKLLLDINLDSSRKVLNMDFKKLWVLTSILTVSGILLGTFGSISAYAGNQSNITLGNAHFAP